ncbi:PREDICTED: uncharacterized protein LOC108770326 isoform X2 [Trachymyrmex cornetzi]|uniref:uncharacterized protein LOC108770326 isoform X2 n=1 Tax=Trachymyrmex cornetzi TaxID=471704 RepID=UPI00084F5F27|nr:PREDICTED: uncharacterized protein LOC108770326 isoform X2 [Trachymyrmex cornetzi]
MIGEPSSSEKQVEKGIIQCDNIRSNRGQIESLNNENIEMEGIEVTVPSGLNAGGCVSMPRDKEENDISDHSYREAFGVREGKLIKMSVMSQQDYQDFEKNRYAEDHVDVATG